MAKENERERTLAPKLPLSVLIVEDNADDAELYLRVLQRSPFDLHVDIAKSRAEFTERLHTVNFDVVLTDYNLGDWTGMDALELLRKQGYDIPVIVVTGALGDQQAVECIKNGATDFVLKDRMERLPIAISRALDDKALRVERQRAELSLQESEAKFRALAEAIPTAVFIEQGTECRYVNRAAERLTGYSRDELLAMNFWQLILPGSRKALIDRADKNGGDDETSSLYKTRILTKKGEVRQLDLTVGMFQIEGCLAALITAIDVTEKNKPIDKSLCNLEALHSSRKAQIPS